MMRPIAKKLLMNKGMLAACLCVASVRIVQFVSIYNERGRLPWDTLFAMCNNLYVGMFIVSPCLILSLLPLCNLLFWEQMLSRFGNRDRSCIWCAKQAMRIACVCSCWMSFVTIVALFVFSSNVAPLGYVLLLVLESSVLQVVYFITCACLFLAGTILSKSTVIASIVVFIYATIDMIAAGIPYISETAPALGWAIVQVPDPYSFMPLVMRAIFPLALAACSVSCAVLAYRRKDFLGNSSGDQHV